MFGRILQALFSLAFATKAHAVESIVSATGEKGWDVEDANHYRPEAKYK